MYCSSCGSAVSEVLSYCNHCGAALTPEKERDIHKPTEASLHSLVWGIVSVVVAGLGIIIGLMALMKNELHFNDGITLGFSLLAFLTILGAEGGFIWLLFRLYGSRERRETGVLKGLRTNELAAGARELPGVSPGITEHTTRTFESIEHERIAE